MTRSDTTMVLIPSTGEVIVDLEAHGEYIKKTKFGKYAEPGFDAIHEALSLQLNKASVLNRYDADTILSRAR